MLEGRTLGEAGKEKKKVMIFMTGVGDHFHRIVNIILISELFFFLCQLISSLYDLTSGEPVGTHGTIYYMTKPVDNDYINPCFSTISTISILVCFCFIQLISVRFILINDDIDFYFLESG